MERVPGEREAQIVLVAGMDDPPALNLAGPHVDGRIALPVDRQEARHRLRPHRVIGFDRAAIVEQHLVEDENSLPRAGDLRRAGEVALDDQRAGHAARHLDVGAAVMMRVIPVGAARVVARNRDLDVIAFARLHRPEDVVGDAAGIDVHAVDMEVRGVEVVRQRHVERHRVRVRRQLVLQPQAKHVARPGAEGGTRDRPFIGPQRQPVAADVLVGIADPQGGAQLAIHGAADFRFDERRPGPPAARPREIATPARAGASSAAAAEPFSRKRRRESGWDELAAIGFTGVFPPDSGRVGGMRSWRARVEISATMRPE